MRPTRRLLLAAPFLLAATPALAAGGGGAKAGKATYVRIPALAAAVSVRSGKKGVITVEPGLDTPDEALRLRVVQSEPRLRAAWFRTVSKYAAGMRPGELPDADLLARLLQADTDQVLGKRGARFLLGSIIVS